MTLTMSQTAPSFYAPAYDPPENKGAVAQQLHDAGLNVIPLPRQPANTFRWQVAIQSRLLREELGRIFQSDATLNLAVIPGYHSNHLAIIKCGPPEVFDRVGRQLKKRNIPLWAATGGAWAGYYYVFIQEGDIKNRPLSPQEIEIIGENQYVLAPPSVDPKTGVILEWTAQEGETPPTVSVNDLDFLGAELCRHVDPIYKGPDGTLSVRTRRFIEEEGVAENWEYEVYLAARDMDGCGFGYRDVIQHLLPTLRRSGLSEHIANERLHSTVHRAFNKENVPATAMLEANLAWYRAQEFDWPTRTVKTDRPVMMALCECARTGAVRGVFRATERKLEEQSGINRKTARRSLKRMRDLEILQRVSIQRDGSHWRFTDAFLRRNDPISAQTYPTYHRPLRMVNGDLLCSHDAAHLYALGHNALHVWTAAQEMDQPVTRGEMAEQTGLNGPQVYRALCRLRDYGVATLSHRAWTIEPLTEDRLDVIATKAGTQGRGQKRRDTHAFERARRVTAIFFRNLRI